MQNESSAFRYGKICKPIINIMYIRMSQIADIFKKAILVISVSAIVFILTCVDVKSQNLKITDGDTIKINGEKITKWKTEFTLEITLPLRKGTILKM